MWYKNNNKECIVIAYEDGKEFSESSAYKIQTPGNYPEDSIQQP
jgi:hypothetical protein